jgi:hypothetical protein
MSFITKLSQPQKIMATGGFLYACGVFYMINYYTPNSLVRAIFVNASKEYDDVKIGHAR